MGDVLSCKTKEVVLWDDASAATAALGSASTAILVGRVSVVDCIVGELPCNVCDAGFVELEWHRLAASKMHADSDASDGDVTCSLPVCTLEKGVRTRTLRLGGGEQEISPKYVVGATADAHSKSSPATSPRSIPLSTD